jgi:hypothetical protein
MLDCHPSIITSNNSITVEQVLSAAQGKHRKWSLYVIKHEQKAQNLCMTYFLCG